jgi:lysophospholipase L1-like esterase
MLFGASLPLSAAGALDRVTFFGDSTTAHLCVRGGIPSNRVWSGAGSTVLFETVNKIKCVHLSAENRDMTLAEAVAFKKPSILVITLGVSGGAGILQKERFTAIYREMLSSVRKASPSTKILVQSILPLSDKSVKHYKTLTRSAVSQANGWIKALCAEMNIPYLDTHSLLIDPATGYLKAEYQNDEYMHLTSAAYAVMLENIKKAIQKLGYS